MEDEPEITVTTPGDLVLNVSAFAALGEPQCVTLLYNEDKHLIAIRGDGKLPVQKQGNLCKISAKAMLRRAGIVVTATTKCEAKLWPQSTAEGAVLGGEALVIDISEIADESEAFKELFETPAKELSSEE